MLRHWNVFAVVVLLASVLAPALAGASVDCDIVGTAGPDTLLGTDGDDVICGLGGNDTIRGFAGNDIIVGGAGDDVIFAGRGHDWIDGGSGADQIDGQQGRDRVYGRSGNDSLIGGRGRDRLRGGPGGDACTDKIGVVNMRSCELDPTNATEGIGSNVEIVEVGGILVAASIADAARALLDDSAADGLSLGGGGFRDPASQIALRKRNCGTSNYAIWEMPASECSPPTAIPGRSQHELGLAIDFTNDGQLIRSRQDPAYLWLDANAELFGFFVHPAEPWHWSTTGN